MSAPAKALSFDGFDDLAESMYSQACAESTLAGVPVGAVIAGVIYHLSVNAQLDDVPATAARTISQAGELYRSFECDTVQVEVSQ